MSVTRQDCIRAAMAGGLSEQDAGHVVDTLVQDKQRLEAMGTAANLEQELARSWTGRMEAAKMEAAQQRRQTALNVLRRQELQERFARVKADGFSAMDGIEALLVGSHKRFFGARDSVDSRRVSIYRLSVGGLIAELERLDPSMGKRLYQEPQLEQNIVREVFELGSTKDALARQAADVFSRHLEQDRLRLNAAGAHIGKLEGYLPQSHDPWKLHKKRTDGRTSRQAWIDLALETVDVERSFPDIAHDGQAVRRALAGIYENISLGKQHGPNALERGEYTGPRNLASGMGQHRVLHFKDADAFLRYNAEYGRGGVFAGVLHHMDAAARKWAEEEPGVPVARDASGHLLYSARHWAGQAQEVSIPAADGNIRGGVRVGRGLTMADTDRLDVAPGDGLEIAGDGRLGLSMAETWQRGGGYVASVNEVRSGTTDPNREGVPAFVTPEIAAAISAIPGEIRLWPFRAAQLPWGWHFCNGDRFAVSSPVGQALLALGADYHHDWRMFLADDTINIPNLFHGDGRGYFLRTAASQAWNGTDWGVGGVQEDTLQNITGQFSPTAGGGLITDPANATGCFRVGEKRSNRVQLPQSGESMPVIFDASLVARTSHETRPVNIGMTPAIFLRC